MSEHTHRWNKEKGVKIRMNRAIGRSPIVRWCLDCDHGEQLENGSVHYGWFTALPYCKSIIDKERKKSPNV
jgi:hypothetical protein